MHAFPHMQIKHPAKCIFSLCTPTETFSIQFAAGPISPHLVPAAPGALVETTYPPAHSPQPAKPGISIWIAAHELTLPTVCLYGKNK